MFIVVSSTRCILAESCCEPCIHIKASDMTNFQRLFDGEMENLSNIYPNSQLKLVCSPFPVFSTQRSNSIGTLCEEPGCLQMPCHRVEKRKRGESHLAGTCCWKKLLASCYVAVITFWSYLKRPSAKGTKGPEKSDKLGKTWFCYSLFVPKSAMLFDPLTHYLHKYINGDHDLNIRCYEKRKSVNWIFQLPSTQLQEIWK